MKNLTRKTMVNAILAAGYILHPCNMEDSTPNDENSIYYLDLDELFNLYNDCI